MAAAPLDPVARARLAPALLAAVLAAAPWTAALLHVLAGFGQAPPETLPRTVLALLGALLGAAVAATAAHVGRDGRASAARGTTLAAATVAGVALALASALPAGLPVVYLATLPVALAVAGLLRALPGRRPELYGAALAYVGATVLANFTFDSFLPLGDFFLVNVGTFFFGVTFTQRDRLHRFGRPVVYRVILFAAAANVAAAWAVGTPLRYVAVSFLAILVSETADTEVYQRLLRRRWIVRVAASNAVSAPLDTVLFTTLAFAGAPFATAAWMLQVIVTDVLVKYGASLVAAITLWGAPPRPVGPR